MKKLKKMLCMLLCLVMAAVILAMPAAAAIGGTPELDRKNDLINMIGDLIMLTEAKQPMTGGSERAVYTGETMAELEKQYEIANDLYQGDWVETPNPELEQLYADFLAAYEGLKVDVSALRDLYSKVKDEANGSEYYTQRYYSERMWRSFCAARQTAQDVLAAQSPDDDTVTNAYFSLRNAFNELCKSNQMVGDVSQNGKVDVRDILLLQKHIAGIITLNSSQRAVANLSGHGSYQISLNDVVILQKFIAEMEVYVASSILGDLNCVDTNPLIDKGWII